MSDPGTHPTDGPTDEERRRDRRLHPEPLHLKPLGDPEPLAEAEPLHPEPLHLDHVGDDDEEQQ